MCQVKHLPHLDQEFVRCPVELYRYRNNSTGDPKKDMAFPVGGLRLWVVVGTENTQSLRAHWLKHVLFRVTV